MEQYSWNQLNETKIIKTIDYSVFKGRSSGIPQAFYEFFDIHPEEKNDKYALKTICFFNEFRPRCNTLATNIT